MNILQGSMLEPDNFAKLQVARGKLEIVKNFKLHLRDSKHQNVTHTLNRAIDHIDKEIVEFHEGLTKGDVENQLEELADIINCCEICAAMIIYAEVPANAVPVE